MYSLYFFEKLIFKTRPVLDRFHNCCKNWSLNQGFCFMVAKKDVMVITSFKTQAPTINKRKKLSKCDVMIFIGYLCILNNNNVN